MFTIDKKGDKYSFEDLLHVMALLRSDEGCPWDKEQSNKTLKVTTIEEAYEVVEAINLEDDDNLKEELGDLLLQVVFHAQIAKDEARFNIDDVTDGIVTKLIRRHPHVFSTEDVKDATEVLVNWENIKREEKKHLTLAEELKQVPRALPSMVRASKVQKKVVRVGFDFPTWQEAFDKVEEEIVEIREAIEIGDHSEINNEIGDLLFSIVNLSRFFGINAENSLTNAIEKFINRFEGIENLAKSRGSSIETMSLSEMDALWNEVKLFSK